jgi:hypothetical protein
MINAPKYIDTKALAELLGFEKDTCEAMRRRGEGPPFIRMGDGKRPAIRYAIADVEAWLAARTVGKVGAS